MAFRDAMCVSKTECLTSGNESQSGCDTAARNICSRLPHMALGLVVMKMKLSGSFGRNRLNDLLRAASLCYPLISFPPKDVSECN